MSRLDEIRARVGQMPAVKRPAELHSVAQVFEDRAFLLGLVERAAEFAQLASEQPPYLPWQEGERISAAARQWRVDAGYEESPRE